MTSQRMTVIRGEGDGVQAIVNGQVVFEMQKQKAREARIRASATKAVNALALENKRLRRENNRLRAQKMRDIKKRCEPKRPNVFVVALFMPIIMLYTICMEIDELYYKAKKTIKDLKNIKHPKHYKRDLMWIDREIDKNIAMREMMEKTGKGAAR